MSPKDSCKDLKIIKKKISRADTNVARALCRDGKRVHNAVEYRFSNVKSPRINFQGPNSPATRRDDTRVRVAAPVKDNAKSLVIPREKRNRALCLRASSDQPFLVFIRILRRAGDASECEWQMASKKKNRGEDKRRRRARREG